MKRTFALAFSGIAIALGACHSGEHASNSSISAEAQTVSEQPDQSAQTLEIAQSFLAAAGSGDGETLSNLMADDFVWHNEGDTSLPWIGGPWNGKDVVLSEFLPAFGAGLTTTSWTTDYSFAKDDQAVFIGTMSATANNTGIDTGVFSWAVRVNVVDGKVKSWNWFEDSFAVSQAYYGEAKPK